MALSPMEQRCSGPCGLVKHVDEFYPRTDPETDKLIGFSKVCRACDKARWSAARDGTEMPAVYDKYGNLRKDSPTIQLFTEAVQLKAIEQIEKDRSLQVCADHIGVHVTTLLKWLDDEREPYASWARRFRLVRAKQHKVPFEKALRQEAEAGNVRAIEFALTTGFPEEYGKKKQEVEMTLRKGADELDLSQLSDEELVELKRLLDKGKQVA